MIKKYSFYIGLSILTLIGGAYFLAPNLTQNDPQPSMKGEVSLPNQIPAVSGLTQNKSTSLDSPHLRSPFSLQTSPAAEKSIFDEENLSWRDFDLATRIQEEEKRFSTLPANQKDQLRQLGYLVPSNYLQLELSELLAMSKKGDTQAMALAGESIALSALKKRAEMQSYTPLSQDDVRQAQQLLEQSVASGNMRSANILSQFSMEQDDEIGARVWLLLAKQSGDLRAEEALRGSFAAPNEQRVIEIEAEVRLAQLADRINSLKVGK